jgi:NitT/TauT family transport system substrate-binding protein
MSGRTMISRRGVVAMLAALVGAGPGGGAAAREALTLGVGSPAGPRHGGYYEAIAYGIYRKYGLEVAIRPIEPPGDPALLVAAGEVDFCIDGNSFQQLDLVEKGIGVVTIAAVFQKDPMAVLAHPGAGLARLEDLRGRTLFVSDQGRRTVWPWLQSRYRLSEAQVQSHDGDPAPFLADPGSVVIGDVIAESFAIRGSGGIEPVVLLPANDIYFTYDGTVQAASRRVERDAELVQRFVDATIEGWYRYLYDDNARANALIEAANGEMTDDRLAQALAIIKKYGLVDSSHALAMGIGAMDGGHWKNFYKATLARPSDEDPPFDRLYSLQFVNQGHGLALKETLLSE